MVKKEQRTHQRSHFFWLLGRIASQRSGLAHFPHMQTQVFLANRIPRALSSLLGKLSTLAIRQPLLWRKNLTDWTVKELFLSTQPSLEIPQGSKRLVWPGSCDCWWTYTPQSRFVQLGCQYKNDNSPPSHKGADDMQSSSYGFQFKDDGFLVLTLDDLQKTGVNFLTEKCQTFCLFCHTQHPQPQSTFPSLTRMWRPKKRSTN